VRKKKGRKSSPPSKGSKGEGSTGANQTKEEGGGKERGKCSTLKKREKFNRKMREGKSRRGGGKVNEIIQSSSLHFVEFCDCGED